MLNRMKKEVKVFGAALDASDLPLTIQMKLAYLNRLAKGSIEEADVLDPYDSVIKFSDILKKNIFKKVGKFPIESWLTPKPNLTDIHLINQLSFQKFTNEGNIKKYSENLEKFIQKEIFPDIPFMIGVDHSLTGGMVTAISHEVEPDKLLVIVFDAHFDGLPASITLKVAKYASEYPQATNPLLWVSNPLVYEEFKLEDNYSCASFLHYLLQDGIILPENLIIFGCQDYPNDEYRSIKNPEIIDYVEFFDSMEQSGVNFIPITKSPEMVEKLNHILKKSNVKNIYLSFDVDVCALKEVIASRFRNIIGLDKSTVLKATEIISKYKKEKRFEIKGLDVMEIDTYLLNKFFPKSNRRDQTLEVIEEYLEILFLDEIF